MLKIVMVWAVACFFMGTAVVLLFKSKWNMGSLAVWLLGIGFSVYGIFMSSIDVWTENGVGFVVKVLLWAGLLVWFGLAVFLAVAGHCSTVRGNEVALVVLGAGLYHCRVSDILERRLIAALDAYRKNPLLLLVVSGGQGQGEDISEALAMQRWLLLQNVPASSILLEDKSVCTRTNLLYSRELLKENGVSTDMPIAVVTNTFHCFRARCYAKEAGFSNVTSIPASMNRPTFVQNYLREAMAIVQYWLRCIVGTIQKSKP